MVVWRLLDGKPGHENQSAGLALALAERLAGRRAVAVHDLAAPPPLRALGYLLAGRFPPGAALPAPALILAAGHATHLAALAVRRARGGRLAVLMRPSLPLALFDLCLIPEHDSPPARADVVVTRGVLNRIRPAAARPPGRGLILIGGPSRHHGWDGAALLAQLGELLRRRPELSWTVADSRRTPADFLPAVAALRCAGVTTVPHTATGRDWLPQQLAAAAEVWVGEDSVSMVYEALTAGAAVGVLAMPRHGGGRVAAGLDRLAAAGLVTPFAAWRAGRPLAPPAAPFDEAGRCADEIVARWGWAEGR